MKCPHCCYAYGNGKPGKYMEWKLYKKIIDMYADEMNKREAFITLGGGEPTLHPEFWRMITYGMSKGRVWLATNGSQTETALTLCELAKKGYLSVALSLDDYHDPIDERVIAAFSEGMKTYPAEGYTEQFPEDEDSCDGRSIRTVKKPFPGGRAKDFAPEDRREGCPCNELQIKVNGDLYPCGCDDAPLIGTVDDGITDEKWRYYDVFLGCWKEQNPMMRREANV
jgi:hypothetical protein